MATASDGSLWYAALIPYGVVISHVTPDGTITEFPVPADDKVNNVYSGAMAVGSDGAVWFSGYESSNVASAQFISRMTPNRGVEDDIDTSQLESWPFLFWA